MNKKYSSLKSQDTRPKAQDSRLKKQPRETQERGASTYEECTKVPRTKLFENTTDSARSKDIETLKP
ncbi:uncharacterized protein RHIMIDRAFT_21669 [Rhizopus microsporus ATCC 52813]|uniref:Uncharacterized protein n=1 Tax=Rhizopus microsporus ATCC 52813 TaxID=1340429 RepID=A0A2G4SR43_RHIZD|nr:uncharacterized protein RHIMIDRAFT_21611 [Rhizopus microsporus ATCC 52813]XP_023464941.1 uncharacterized protein RHIMIDRAFT_21669 [Rhizopus microsporus ATCC 52813]PHZ11227.1 hypothetical protein RHIMIDRAFT_21611 [Rhizopus microsporus ATCC 52813]PHZ11233.1 hypothetical protein RHIMIDRAFT_21669 [Rhizopus microsporus ATCC 52813]